MKWLFFILSNFLLNIANSQIINTLDSFEIGDINGVVFDSYGNLYFADLVGNQIKMMDTNYHTSIVAGTGSSGYGGDGGQATGAKLKSPVSIAIGLFGNLYITDADNQRIRKIDITSGVISTVAGTGTSGFSGDGGPASSALLNEPDGICFDKFGNLYFSDFKNYRVRKIDTLGIITTVAGNGILGSTGDGGAATLANCYPTTGIIVDNSGNLFFTQADYTIRKVSSSGIISTIAGDTSFYTYNGDDIPALEAHLDGQWIALGVNGLLYISDDATNVRIRMIDSFGLIHTIAGTGINGHTGDGGLADSAEISPTGIAFDRCGNLIFGEVSSSLEDIRKITFDSTCSNSTTKVSQLLQSQIAIYPNPVLTTLHIDGVESASKYELFNIIGIIEQSGTLQKGSNELPISTLPPGMYLLQLTDEQGRKTMKKVVKE